MALTAALTAADVAGESQIELELIDGLELIIMEEDKGQDDGGVKCGACTHALLDDDGQPRTTALHHCRACNAPLHSAILCDKVWEPILYGHHLTFCGKSCVEAYNRKLTAEVVNDDDEEPLPAPDLLPVRRRENEPPTQQRAETAARRPAPEGRVMGVDIPYFATLQDQRNPDDVAANLNAGRGSGSGRGGPRAGAHRPRVAAVSSSQVKRSREKGDSLVRAVKPAVHGAADTSQGGSDVTPGVMQPHRGAAAAAAAPKPHAEVASAPSEVAGARARALGRP